ncbi:class I adenylate-forming enzyme family protein [Nocardia sp. NPDC048505]|uniref:class I adenylate-forming enzyme family protein n=1 Tax=unclassified Nocardia TaxID=2637762 RepID=UPI0034046AC4
MLLYDTLVDAMRRHPETPVGTGARTFGELLDEHAAKRRILDAEFPGGGARMLLAARNYPGYISTLLAILGHGSLPVLADPALSAPTIDTLTRDCGIDALITETSGDAALDERTGLHRTGFAGPAPATAPGTELCRLTSGSTRTPACIEFSAEAVLNAATGWAAAVELTPRDRTLCFAGVYNGLAFNTTLIPSLLTGSELVLPGTLPTGGSMLRHIAASRPSILVAFPAAYERLAAYPVRDEETRAALAAIRLRLSSAATLPDAVAARMEELSGPVCDYYGLAETGPVTVDLVPQRGTHGRPLPGVLVRMKPRPADGLPVLHVRTASMGTRYLNYPGEFERAIAADGSYISADTGVFTAGRLRLTGRSRPGLEIGGRKFTLESVADPIRAYPGVADCHVTQLTTPSGRACVGALVAADPAVEIAALKTHLRERLADYQVPEVIVVVPELPRGSTGKVRAAEALALLTAVFRSAEEVS